ncbi:hypothetical protein FOMPIDRAFT_1062361, partial [Fomitopsis schrenkii]
MGLLTRNNDILSLIVKMLSSHEAIPLSSTSRGLYAVARRHALSCIRVRSQMQLKQMHSCLVGASGSGDRMIRPTGLSVAGSTLCSGRRGRRPPRDHECFNYAFIDILKQLPELEHLQLLDCEGILSAHSDLRDCIIAAKNIAYLAFEGMGPIALDVLYRMACRPRRVSLSWSWARRRDVDQDMFLRISEAPVLDEARDLAFSSFDLRSRWIDYYDEEEGEIGSDPIVELRPRSRPHLKTLTLAACFSQPFLAMFPEIRELCMEPDIPNRRIQVPKPPHLDILSTKASYVENVPFA